MKNLLHILITLILSFQTILIKGSDTLNNCENFVFLNGIQHWVKISGAKNNTTPIVIVHGGPGGNNYNFERTVGPLLEKFATIIYYDQRGCGRSKAPIDTSDYTVPSLVGDLESLRETLGLDEMTLLGYSFGAELSLRYAAVYPNHVKQLILSSPVELSTSNFLIQIHGFYSVANKTLRGEIENILIENVPVKDKFLEIWDTVPQSIVGSYILVNQDVARINRQMWEDSKLPCEGSFYFQNVIFENSKGDLLETVNGFDEKCLIISGINDKNGGLQTGIELNKILPNSELKLYEKSAHFPDMEEHVRFANDIWKFVIGD